MHGHDRPCAGHPGETRADRLGHRLVELVGYDAADVVRLEDLCQITHRGQASRTTATCAPTCVNRLTRRGPVQPPRGTKPEPTGNTGQSGGPSPGTAPRAPAKLAEGQRAGSAASAGVRGSSPGDSTTGPGETGRRTASRIRRLGGGPGVVPRGQHYGPRRNWPKDSEQDPPPRRGSGGRPPGTALRAPAKLAEGQRAGSAASAGVRGSSPGDSTTGPGETGRRTASRIRRLALGLP